MTHEQKARALYRQLIVTSTTNGRTHNYGVLEQALRTAHEDGIKAGLEMYAAEVRQLTPEQVPSASEKPPQA